MWLVSSLVGAVSTNCMRFTPFPRRCESVVLGLHSSHLATSSQMMHDFSRSDFCTKCGVLQDTPDAERTAATCKQRCGLSQLAWSLWYSFKYPVWGDAANKQPTKSAADVKRSAVNVAPVVQDSSTQSVALSSSESTSSDDDTVTEQGLLLARVRTATSVCRWRWRVALRRVSILHWPIVSESAGPLVPAAIAHAHMIF